MLREIELKNPGAIEDEFIKKELDWMTTAMYNLRNGIPIDWDS